ncbi:MAG: FAD-dependent oxidoreductase, partial [Candidatus Marsarchaeota archaeon]
MKSVDVLVIGGGGGGYPGAFRLSRAGYSVLMVDPKGVLGGNCLYSGCVPSKTVREMSLLAARARKFLGAQVRPEFFSEVQ